ncbi:recombinase family protein [Mycolicibacterium fortuitum]|uniref:recombinase family protein n=1 Tax=Mycolicibacterium fortuitum TaxID=1766 RepID=UPI0005361AFC|nr:recombinase family protein [Mycolicibacterium fortuitum]WEV33460.1 recombinase family protein [Mycolicibacterium fortuitum]
MSTAVLRVLGAVRLSKLTDESTSPVRQRERIEWWAQGHQPATVVSISEDLDTSGAVDPFKRASLGKWLTDTPPEPWDVLVAWKLDRISRSSMDTETLLRWCLDRGKRIVCVDDGIDTDTQMGQVWVKLASIFAEVERNAIKERTTQARKKLRSESRWGGETVHYGLKPEQIPTGGYRLVHDDEAVAVIRRIVADVMRGDSVQSIADRLTAEGVPSSRDRQRQLQGREMTGAAWSTTTLHRLLESKTLLGYTVHQGDADPEVMKSEPILTASEFRSLQAVLEQRKRPKTTNRTSNASPLLGVAFCLDCGVTLHQKSQLAKGKRYRYYYCPSKPQHGNKIPGEWLEQVLEEAFLHELGDAEVHEPVLVPASDHTDELESARMQLETVASAMRKATSQTVLEVLAEQVAELDARIAELETLPVQPARTEHIPTGRTYAEDWKKSDTDARRRLLLDSGIRYEVLVEGRTRTQGGAFKSNLLVPEDIRDRMVKS